MPARLAGQLLGPDGNGDGDDRSAPVRPAEPPRDVDEDGAAPEGFDLHEFRHLVDGSAEMFEDVVEESVDLIEDTFGLHRRVWAHGELGHAQIEVRGIEDPEASSFRQRLARRLNRLEGVSWAEVNAITGRVAVAFDGSESTLTSLLDLIEGLEDSFGARRQEHRPSWDTDDRADHPADDEPIHRTIAIITGDVLSLSWTVIGRAARIARLPTEFAGLLSVVDSTPWMRDRAKLLLGRRGAALALPLASAVASGVSQGPLGTLVDLGQQAALLGEYRARRRVWEQREPEFYAVHDDDPIDPPDLPPRPAPLPPGPIERWAGRAGQLGLGAASVSYAATRDVRRSADLLLASAPKAARVGREGFAAILGRTLAYRGIVPLDASSLRRLDRIDTVVLDVEVAIGERRSIRSVIRPDGSAADDRLESAAARLFDPDRPEARHTRGRWRLLPFADLDRDVVRRARGALTRSREISSRGGLPLALLREGELVGLVDIGLELADGVAPVVDAIRAAGHRLVVADDDGEVARRLGADERVRSGGALGDDVRRLQADGAGVLVIGRQGHRGLAAADVGVGVVTPTGRPSWGADLILGRELADAATIVFATTVAREVSQRSARFAVAGSGLGALMAVTGTRTTAGSRGLAMVNGAAGASLVSGAWAAVRLGHEPRPTTPDRTPWHAYEPGRVVRMVGSDADRGLASGDVEQRRQVTSPAGSEVSPFEPFLAEAANPLNPILAVGAGLSAATGSMVDAGLVLGLIGINSAVGGLQRLRADRTVRQLLADDRAEVTVIRDSRRRTVRSDRLVHGDVLELHAPDAVPADARILETDRCEVDESSLTGESLPVAKSAEPADETDVADRSSMLYQGTNLVTGSVKAVVVATGEHTEVARSLALTGPPPPTGVELRLEELTRRLLPAALGVAGSTGLIGLLRRWPLTEIAGTTVSLAIASVPEGLPFVATAGQLAGARRLAHAGAVVRNPRTVEALGRVDVLCVDKTGTLTEGRVALVAVSDGRATTDLRHLDDRARGVLEAAQLASDQPGDGDRDLSGLDDADRALHEAARRNGHRAAGRGWELLADLPFEASRGLHGVLGRRRGETQLVVKGAPEVILDRCATWEAEDGEVALDGPARQEVEHHLDELARQGHRLLAVARRSAPEISTDDALEDEALEGLCLMGAVVLADPVRETAAEAIRGIGEAGVRTIMVTGDHPETAASIARQLGFDGEATVLTGAELAELDDDELASTLERVRVVARVTPADKLRIVTALQSAGHVVAMTGDGANDAAAIRTAQVGVALGQRSSDAAREAADIVVTDDRIETLIDAIAEGRALWGSIREALAVLVGGNLGEIGFTSIASAFSNQAPLHPRQFLLVNLLTDLAPAVAIAVRPPDDVTPETLLREGPDRSLGAALRRDVAIRGTATALGAGGAWAAARLTGTPNRAGTVGLAALVGTQLGQTLVAGGWRRPATLLTVAGSAAAFFGIVQTPGVSRFFGSRPLGPLGWWQAGTASVLATIGSETASRLASRLDELAAGATPGEVADAGDGGGDGAAAGPVTARRRLGPDFGRGPQRVVVLGTGGAVGERLVARLADDGHEVAWVRTEEHADDGGQVSLAGVPPADVSVVDGGGPADRDTVLRAADGANVAYVLRGALPGETAADPEAARREANRLAHHLDEVGVDHVVRVGALVDDTTLARASDDAFASDQVAAGLRSGRVPVTEVRTGMVVGRRDPAFELALAVARLPVRVEHPFLQARVQPVAVDALVRSLAAAGTEPTTVGRVIDVGGSETLTFEELLTEIRAVDARIALVRLPARRVPTPVLERLLARATGHSTSVIQTMLRAARTDAVVLGSASPGRDVVSLPTDVRAAIAGAVPEADVDAASRSSARAS